MKVGVLDDNVDYAIMTCKHLSRAGFETLISYSPQEFLKNLEQENLDAALIDIVMPGKNGLEIVKEIRSSEKSKDMAIVFITSSTVEKEFIEESKRLGVDWVFTKPLNSKQLIDVIKILNEKYKTKKELKSQIRTLEEELFRIRGNGDSLKGSSYDIEDIDKELGLIPASQDEDIRSLSSDFNKFMENLNLFQIDIVTQRKKSKERLDQIQTLKVENAKLEEIIVEKETEIESLRSQIAKKVEEMRTYEDKLAELKIIFDKLFESKKVI